MFNLFGKKEIIDESLNPLNPAALFSLVGLDQMWNELVRGEHRAIKEYKKYQNYKESLLKEYKSIDFNRIIKHEDSDCSYFSDITVGETMYLRAFENLDGLYIAKQDNYDEVEYLSFEDLRIIIRKMTYDEKQFSSSLISYIDNNIRPMVEDTLEDLYGYSSCKTIIPINTKEVVKYHKFLAADMGVSDTSDIDSYEISKKGWDNIKNAPLFRFFKYEEKNPIIPINLNYIDVFVLDWLCYSTMVIPTIDTYKLLHYKNEEAKMTTKQAIINTYGENASILIEKTLTDLSCSAFRSFIRQGSELQEAKNRDDVLKYIERFNK